MWCNPPPRSFRNRRTGELSPTGSTSSISASPGFVARKATFTFCRGSSKIFSSHEAFNDRRKPSIAGTIAATTNPTWCRDSGRTSCIREFLLQVFDDQGVGNQRLEILDFEIDPKLLRKRRQKRHVRNGVPGRQ